MRYLKLILIVLLFSGCASSPRSKFIDGATFLAKQNVDTNQANKEWFEHKHVMLGHQVSLGEGAVLTSWRIDNGVFYLTDSGGFDRLSIWIKQGAIQKGIEIQISDNGNIVSFYSHGSSAFPTRGGCFGYAKAGAVRLIDVKPQELLAEIDLEFELHDIGGFEGQCKDVHLKEKITFSRTSSIESLSIEQM